MPETRCQNPPQSIRDRTQDRRFERNTSGSAAIEFAFIAAPLIALCLAALQTTIIFLAEQQLQTATRDAARLLKRTTGDSGSQAVSGEDFKAQVCARAGPMLDCQGLMVDVQAAAGFGGAAFIPLTLTYGAGTAVTNSWSYDPGQAGDVVIVRVMYNWPVVGTLLGIGLSNQPGDRHLMVGTAVYKNEPVA
jgi:Flp pilus assembly protein TadG